MTDEGNKLVALVIGVLIALLIFVSSTIRDALFGVISDIIDGVLGPFGIFGLGKFFFTLISVVPSFIEVTIAYSLLMIVAGGLSFILGFLNRR